MPIYQLRAKSTAPRPSDVARAGYVFEARTQADAAVLALEAMGCELYEPAVGSIVRVPVAADYES